ncbi:hypothetical protein [Alteribacillus bidgolensis]|uniref:Uncharacterized protein n=1 Tax=Alteribacillus bidgolensis TaxID=930129 RepID=A0A1G8H7Y8_9BACI|nr:hypothetical protein [Alteribacillus bidgolensis]SDI02745.1 hypothetical protein SAMN05216352_104147 [Alteribacillus bidgolensis]
MNERTAAMADGDVPAPNPVFFKGEKGLVLTGLLGFVLGSICAIYSVFFGAVIPPEGDLTKAISFNFAIGLFLLTTAAIVPFAGLSPGKRRFFTRSYIILALYSYGIETIQHFRGLDPRFSQYGQVSDLVFGGIFALVAISMIVYYAFFGWMFFREGSMKQRPSIMLGIRYGMITTMMSFTAGLWIIAIQSRYTGMGGNIIWLHGLGFHGLQLVPLLGWMLEKGISEKRKNRLIHVTGIAWILVVLCIGVQTIMGRSIFDVSIMMLLAYGFVLVCVVTSITAIFQFFQNRDMPNGLNL